MKPWRDLSEILKPAHISALPTDPRGYPIPVTTVRGTDGKIDFRSVDVSVSHRCFVHSLCSICGQSLGRHRAFVGGPRSIVFRMFHDLWMHRDCAEYALQVCPFIAAPKFAYARSTPEVEGHEIHTLLMVSTERPVVFGMGVTDKGAEYVNNGGDVVIKAGLFHTISWWAFGKEITPQEATDIIIAAREKKS